MVKRAEEVHIHIDELVLDASTAQEKEIAAAVQRELTKVLSGTIPVDAAPAAEAAGRRVAGAVGGGLQK